MHLDEANTTSAIVQVQPDANRNNSSSTFPKFVSYNPSPSVDKIHQPEKDEIWELFARACYATNTPLNITENVHWKRVFNKINPNLKLPSCTELSNPLLDNEHGRIREQVIDKIKTAKTIGIQLDGWNAIITTPDPVLYKIIDSNIDCDEANYLTSIIDEIGVHKIMSIITNDATGELLNQKYTFGYFSCYECCANILNLLINDLFKIELFSCTIKICNTIVKCVKSSQILNSTFTHIQKVQNSLNNKSCTSSEPVLKHSGQTRCLQSLRLNKENLQQLAITETVLDEINAEVRYHIFDEKFWLKIDLIYNLLQPISAYIIKIQTSKYCISEVVEIFNDLKTIFKDNCPPLQLEAAQVVLQKRKQLSVKPIHLAANLLDPKYMGKILTNEEHTDAFIYINNLSPHLITESDNIGQVMADVALYKAKEEFFAKDFLWTALSSGALSSVLWWKSFCSSVSLSKLAIEILNCPSTKCSTEKRKNALDALDTKLLFVHCNLKLSQHKTLLLQNDEPCTFQDLQEFISINETDFVTE